MGDGERYHMVLLNQGLVEQTFLDSLRGKGVVKVEYGVRAETLVLKGEEEDEYPVEVGVRRVGADGMAMLESLTVADSLIVCDRGQRCR